MEIRRIHPALLQNGAAPPEADRRRRGLRPFVPLPLGSEERGKGAAVWCLCELTKTRQAPSLRFPAEGAEVCPGKPPAPSCQAFCFIASIRQAGNVPILREMGGGAAIPLVEKGCGI